MTTKRYAIKGFHTNNSSPMTQYHNTRTEAAFTAKLMESSGYNQVNIYNTTDFREWVHENFWNVDLRSAAKHGCHQFNLPLNVVVKIYKEFEATA